MLKYAVAGRAGSACVERAGVERLVADDSILILDDDGFDAEINSRSTPILVDFWADWCAPCRLIAPVLEELATEFAGRAQVAKVDVDANGDLTNRFGILSIPTLMVFREGRVIDQLIGAAPKEKIRALIERHLD